MPCGHIPPSDEKPPLRTSPRWLFLSGRGQMWREPTSELPEQTAGWQGEIEHIQSGRRWLFDSIRRKVEGSEELE